MTCKIIPAVTSQLDFFMAIFSQILFALLIQRVMSSRVAASSTLFTLSISPKCFFFDKYHYSY